MIELNDPPVVVEIFIGTFGKFYRYSDLLLNNNVRKANDKSEKV